MRKKLERLGVHLPLLPLTAVGSFPKSDAIRQFRKVHASGHSLERSAMENAATQFWMGIQESLGYHVLVHGEMERGDMVAYFGEQLTGFTEGNPEEPVRSYGNRYWIPPEITAPVRWEKPVTVDVWRFAQALTAKPVKGMLTGPGTIYDWSLDGFYGDRQRAMNDIATAVRCEIAALIAAGCRIIQIDEPSLAQTLEHFAVLRETFQHMLSGLHDQAYFIMHTCYGQDVFAELYPKLLELPVDNLDLETANSGMELLETIAAFPVSKDLSLGVVDVHRHDTESTECVRDRIQAILNKVPAERLWLGPDCGLKTRSVEEAQEKLSVIARARELILT